jgi:hypothetical protein
MQEMNFLAVFAFETAVALLPPNSSSYTTPDCKTVFSNVSKNGFIKWKWILTNSFEWPHNNTKHLQSQV